jgi:hypothetical protein
VNLKKSPRESIFDSQDHQEHAAYISWNYLRELTYAQAMHVGTQPLLLRQCARHIAEVWEKKCERRPVVRAETAVSLNGRPLQLW